MTLPSTAQDFAVERTATPTSDAERAQVLEDPKFGMKFSDHMVRMTWTDEDGWQDRRVEPYAPLQMDPAASVLHYANEIFEGLKAYKWADGSIWTFRPQANAERLQRSARRMALPEVSVEDFIGSIEALVQVDSEWVPTAPESSLYLRPFTIATDVFLGLRRPKQVDYLVIASPSGPYFHGGVKPVSIWVERDYHRAGPGGTGAAKCGGNYASSLMPMIEAGKRGFDQVMYLDAVTSDVVEELGGMNVFIVLKDGTVATPILNGNILEGVTRSSIIELLSERDYKVVERDITVSELREGIANGDVVEAFACGTAAIITPMGRLAGEDFDLTIGDGQPGDVTMSVRQQLTDIQYGRAEDTYGWMHRLA